MSGFTEQSQSGWLGWREQSTGHPSALGFASQSGWHCGRSGSRSQASPHVGRSGFSSHGLTGVGGGQVLDVLERMPTKTSMPFSSTSKTEAPPDSSPSPVQSSWQSGWSESSPSQPSVMS